MSSTLVERGLDTTIDFAAYTELTTSLVIPAVQALNEAVKGDSFKLPPADCYLFEMVNLGTIDDAGHTAKLDMLLQMQLASGTWQDYAYVQAANLTIQRAIWGLFGGKAAPAVTTPISSTGPTTNKISDTGASTNAVSVTPGMPVNSLLGLSGQLGAGRRPLRLVGVPRTAQPSVGDTIKIFVTALVDPNEGV